MRSINKIIHKFVVRLPVLRKKYEVKFLLPVGSHGTDTEQTFTSDASAKFNRNPISIFGE
jgi:hypothetical protein